MIPRCLLALALALPGGLAARDFDFDNAVEDMENRLGKRRLRIPFLGLAVGAAGLVGRPLGATGFRMAIFEDVRTPESVIREPFGEMPSTWRPLLRVREARETVSVYARDEGDWAHLLMAVVERNEVVLMRFKLRPSRLMAFLAERAIRHHRND